MIPFIMIYMNCFMHESSRKTKGAWEMCLEIDQQKAQYAGILLQILKQGLKHILALVSKNLK